MPAQGKIEWKGPDKYNKGYVRLKIDGEWYGCKEDRDDFEPGYTIKFETEREGKDLLITRSKVLEKGSPPQKKGGGGGKGGGGYWNSKEKTEADARREAREVERRQHELLVVEPRIVYVNARDHAIATVGLLLSNGAVELGKEGEARQKIVRALIDEITKDYFKAAIDLAKAAQKGKAEAAPAKEEPKAEAEPKDTDDDWGDDSDDDWDNE